MNKVMLTGRLTRDPEIRYSAAGTAIGHFIIAIDRPKTKEGDDGADFPSVVAFGKPAEFAEKYLHKGTKVEIVGHIQTGQYTDKEGRTVFTTDVIAETLCFAESKNAGGSGQTATRSGGSGTAADDDGFISVPDGTLEEDGLPFN